MSEACRKMSVLAPVEVSSAHRRCDFDLSRLSYPWRSRRIRRPLLNPRLRDGIHEDFTVLRLSRC